MSEENKTLDLHVVKHRFLNHEINPDTEILIIGTFNPDSERNDADFFYSRSHNNLWKLLPLAFGDESLKKKTKIDKLEFIKKWKIDFIDLISEVCVNEQDNYYDNYIDSRVSAWRDIIGEIKNLKNLRKVCFTRKTLVGIPQMTKQIEEIRRFCESKNITFQSLLTPARYYSKDKQQEWNIFFQDGSR